MSWDGKTERRQDTSTMLQWLSEFGSELRSDVKETITELKCDIRTVKEDVKDLDDKVTSINTKVSNFEVKVFDEDTGIITKVEDHHKKIYGNGHKGLLTEFTEFKTKFYTGLAIATFIGGVLGWVITIIVSILK